jgi:hypothetical protein
VVREVLTRHASLTSVPCRLFGSSMAARDRCAAGDPVSTLRKTRRGHPPALLRSARRGTRGEEPTMSVARSAPQAGAVATLPAS